MGIFGKVKKGSKEIDIEEYLDTLGLDADDMLEEHADMWVKPMTLEDISDVEAVNNEVKKGNMVILNIQPLYKKNTIKLRQAVSEIKGMVHEINGDIARVTEYKVLVTPARVKVVKE
ncbi:hypothetical protein DRN74_01005 [Candidatus Micrarchaeota archaeon]|nr:MAG: hypothetical protein DRN74_01005 [Candidatus Micrarchaeota archaeon]